MPDFGRWSGNGGDPSLNEINRTDQFLDALAGQQRPFVTDRGEADLAQLLAGWRDDIRETPMGHVATPQQAEVALDKVTRPAPRRRLSLAVIGSAAAAVLAIGGVGAVVAGSGPGDALYGLRTILFGEQDQTRDDAVILAAQTEMQQVQQLIEQGDWQGAQAKLEAVTTTVATVDDVARKEELVTQWQELTVKVEAQDAAATAPPGAPLPTFPDVPVVVLDTGTSSTTEPVSETPSTTPVTTSPVTSETPSTSVPTTSPVTTPPSSGPATTTSTSSSSAPTTTTTTAATTTAATSATSTTTSTTSAEPSATSTISTTASTTPSVASTSSTATTSSAPSSAVPTTTTTVVVQSTTATRAPRTASTTVAVPSPTAEELPTVLPTTTTPLLPLPLPLPLPGGEG